MMRDELIDRLKRAVDLIEYAQSYSDGVVRAKLRSAASFVDRCAGEIMQLDSPPTMAWQAANREGRAYVLGYDGVFEITQGKFSNSWEMHSRCDSWELGERDLVCYIPAPPPLPKRGDK